MISELMNRHEKLILCLFIAFLALLFCGNIDGYTDDEDEYWDITGHFKFTVDSSGCATITGGNSADIPATVSYGGSTHSYPVTCIGAHAFHSCGLTGNLTIPSGVTEIGEWAFSGCSGLTGNLTIPSGVTEIGDSTFWGCSGLTGALTIPGGVTVIGDCAFCGCSGLTGKLIIPSSVTKIGDNAFEGCSGLTGALTIPSGVTEIGDVAFCSCSGLTGNLTIPDSVMVIGDCAFYGCSGLTGALTIPNSVTKIGSYAFYGCSSLTGTLTIPSGITKIESYAFYGCSGLTGVLTIPNGVTEIESHAFYGCSSLTGTLTIPSSVSAIGSHAFYSCSGLTGALTIPDSVTAIGNWAFYGCSGLTGALTIPGEVTAIGNGAFCGCNGLRGALTIPDGITEIGACTFENCSGLTGNLTIPSGVTKIGDFAFYGCSGLTGNLTIPSSVTEIGEWAFYSCSGLTGALTISDSVTAIGEWAFCGCSSLTGNLTIPSSLTEIGGSAFCGCSGLTGNLTIPSSVTAIGEWAFCGCSGLTGALTISGNVTSIGVYAFDDCNGLEHVYFQGDAPTIADTAFTECALYGHYPKDNGTWTSDKLQNYGGEITWTPTQKLTLSRYKSVIPSNSYFYRGISVAPEYDQQIKIYCYETDELLVQDRDYTVEYSDPVNVGACTVTVRGINGYDGINGVSSGTPYSSDGSLQGGIIIYSRSLTNWATIAFRDDAIALKNGVYLYTGDKICPEITVTCLMDDNHVIKPGMKDWPYAGIKTLTKDKDYTVTYSDNTEPGDAKITVEGIGNFCSTITVKFRILSTIELPTSVTKIGSQAFCDTAAEAVVIPETCEAVAADAFDNCPNLKYIVNNSNVDISADYEGSSVTVISNGNNS